VTMSDTVKYKVQGVPRAGDCFLLLLAVVLMGYALMGKGFAYLGFPPLYVGEIAFLFGIFVFLRSGTLLAALTTVPTLVLVVAMMWVLARTLPYVSIHGFDALRDSVVILYGGFAFIIIGLLLEDARRIDTVIRYYKAFIYGFPGIPLGFWLTKYWEEYIPKLYGSNVPIVEIGASALGTHLAGAGVFILIGYQKVSWFWGVIWVGTLAMIAATNRGATVAAAVALVLAMVVLGRLRMLVGVLVVGLGTFCIVLAVEVAFFEFHEVKDSDDRPVSAQQILENVKSIAGQSGQQTEGTKQWRLDWWEVIVNDTLKGPNFWSGRGFGLNLADADGFGESFDPVNPRPPTRSPHNVHMTLLARAGVIGVVLWLLVLLSWGGTMLWAILVARARGHKQWSNLFLWITCYAVAIVINATFDVALEGPMQGIWFWSLFGFGIGTVMVYRAAGAVPLRAFGQ